MSDIRQKFEILGMAEEGFCECCGARCPKRRVAVVPIDDGGSRGEVQQWGVICASKIRGSSQSAIVNEANHADHVAKLEAADRERRFAYRVGAVVPGDTPQGRANLRYRRTGRSLVGSYFLGNAAGEIVRVDGNDPADVELFRSRGFVEQLSDPVKNSD